MPRLRAALNIGSTSFLYVGVIVFLYCMLYIGVCSFYGVQLPPNFSHIAFLWWVGLSTGVWLVGIAILVDEG